MIKARNCITWSNQYVAHRDVKRTRRDVNKDIEFGLETYLDEQMEGRYEPDPEEMEHWVIDAFRTGEMPVFAAKYWGIIP
jgi:hypothetical protein